MANSIQILKEISQLIFLVENSSIQKTDKLKLIKVLFVLKLKLIELLEKELKMEGSEGLKIKSQSDNRSFGVGVNMAKSSDESIKLSNKQDLIIQFIKDKSRPVSPNELLSLGIAGRSLRRYIKSLIDGKKIKIEKSGRNHFYSLA
ncbi:MAG: hypothetical protein G01um10142_353 [Parcubacteria group bacterium Gr01-1014_2]|nr:MAG: hypothetical protein G01um10142_353 [Parcubacteria group bacterium Gr01-1014_2]